MAELINLRAARKVRERAKARAEAAESALAQTRAVASTAEAMIKHLKLEIAKLRREHYGHSSERRARLIDQMELQLEELEAAAAEDEIAAEKAAKTTPVAGFERRQAVGRGQNLEIFRQQPDFEQFHVGRDVVDDENACGHQASPR